MAEQDKVAAADPWPTVRSPGESAPAELPVTLPEKIGRYVVRRVLGSGGFGRVYLADDEELARPVAIKVPHPHLVSQPSDAEAYLIEARNVANLDHPNIVPVHDVGSTEQFPCYVVSKYVDGTDLATRLNESRLTLHETVALVATVAEALHHAHKHGLVHRDIKPGNILLDKSGKPFIADFGLALREQDVGKGPCFAGTPAYMSPEQARGEGHRVDGRSDVFSLGVVLYESLTGRRPFHGDTQQELLENVTTIDARPPRQWDDTIPKELERICLKSLSKRASDRYSTAKDMADDLRFWLRPLSETTTSTAGGPATGQTEFELPAIPGLVKDAFLSYATADKEVAYRLCGLLEEQGIGCWIAPRDVSPGDDYGESIIRAIEGTNATLLLLSAQTNASIHVTHEVERATSKRKRVIPIRLEDVLPSPSLELHLAAVQWVDAWRLSPAQVAAQLAPALKADGRTPSTRPELVDTSPITPAGDTRPLKIVPKGLRSFDAQDADFFLELLPGPRDRNGLPDSIRFWKTRIEETDPDNTFSVGLIYGPSGCGKSSLVKAGLLPRLSKDVLSVYVEATADETEKRLLNGLRKRFPELPRNLDLKDALAALRQGESIPAGKKVLIVLDQFEQWLHAKKEELNPELVEALRQCDGIRVQCVVMVRDDFWMAATRFMRGLEVDLVPGRNVAVADLFDLDHARNVLAAFGRAFGKLPEKTSETSKEQQEFLKQAVSGLAQEGKVVCVRLALFAEMMKGKTWTPATLKEVGGIEGVGVTFLEETFSSATANPKHRLHQKAARVVLKTLLPESGSDIKGHMRSYADLLEESGYADRPKEFDELIQSLDGEIRLITPTDPDGKEGAGDSAPMVKAGEKYYQLTHDYLVPSLREWLTRKQRETRKGRAELRLAERSALWTAKPEDRQLPWGSEFLSIRLLTDKKNWTEPQRAMMRKAGRYHGILSGVVVALLIFLAEASAGLQAKFLVDRLVSDNIDQVPRISDELAPSRPWADSMLRRFITNKYVPPKAKLHASLALVKNDQSQVDFLFVQMLIASPEAMPVIVKMLTSYKARLQPALWEKCKGGSAEQRIRAATALAIYDPESKEWEQAKSEVVTALVSVSLVDAKPWIELLKDVGNHLALPLETRYRDRSPNRDTEHPLVAAALAVYLKDSPQQLADLVTLADSDGEFLPLLEALRAHPEAAAAALQQTLSQGLSGEEKLDERDALWKRQANAVVCLFQLGDPHAPWHLLKLTTNPSLRSFIIDRYARLGGSFETLVDQLGQEADAAIQQAIVLALGEFDVMNLSEAQRRQIDAQLESLYRTDPDPGVHSAVAWSFRRWGRGKTVEKLDVELRDAGPENGKNWFLKHGLKFVVVQPGTIDAPDEYGKVRPVSVDHRFAISATEVTVEQFQKLLPDIFPDWVYARTSDCPMNNVSWYDAALYCNLLSKVEGLEPCYEPNPNDEKNGGFKRGMNIAKDFLKRTGYRLPTEAEWEYACRAGTTSTYFFGEPKELLDRYAWFERNSYFNGEQQPWPVGELRPNGLGCFDMLGNVVEWCNDSYRPTPDDHYVSLFGERVSRGGAFNDSSELVHSAIRYSFGPSSNLRTSFRTARTYPRVEISDPFKATNDGEAGRQEELTVIVKAHSASSSPPTTPTTCRPEDQAATER